jgi:hypothetical protein
MLDYFIFELRIRSACRCGSGAVICLPRTCATPLKLGAYTGDLKKRISQVQTE